MSDSCVFCKIIKGEIPCYKIYEDDHVIALLDIAPFEKGHTLVIPKCHVPHFTDLPVAELEPVMVAVQKMARRLMEKLPCDGFNLLQNNGACASQTVPHIHIHIIPRWNGGKEPMKWIPGAYKSQSEIQALYERLSR